MRISFSLYRQLLYPAARRGWWGLKGYPGYRLEKLLKESQWWPRLKLEGFRDEKLSRLIDHCYHHVPYYRDLMDERGLKPSDVRSLADLRKLPVLSKEAVRTNWPKLQASNIHADGISIVSTGGTTGEPMRIARSIQGDAWATMGHERGLSWGGLVPGMPYIHLTGGSLQNSKRHWHQCISDTFSGRISLPAFDLTRENVLEYASLVQRSHSAFIVGYASSIYHFARLLLEQRYQLPLQAAFTTSERLFPRWAKIIREAMKCRVYSYYGCAECTGMAFQCHEGEAYHVSEEHVILEVASESEPTGLPGSGQVLITDLDNYAMPLLRYRNGDWLILGDNQCACGRTLKLIAKLEGRVCEFLLSTTRQPVSAGICDFIIGKMDSINEFQVRQDALNHIRVLVVTSRKLTDEDNAYIRESFRYYLGPALKVEIQSVDGIPRTRSQKLQTAINEIGEVSELVSGEVR